MDISTLKKSEGATHSRKRIGRGEATGQGGTAGRGHKGANSRSGSKTRPWFEGGQMPLQRRLPKFGFYHHSKKVYQVVNLDDLEKVAGEKEINPATLQAKGLVKKADAPVKILGEGELTMKLNVHAHAFSKSAREKIEKAGGSVTEL